MSVEENLSCFINESLLIEDQITTTGTRRGTPIDITGWALKAVIHKVLGDGVELLTYTTGDGEITIPVGTDGTCDFSIPNADIVTLGVGDFVYYIARTDSGQEANLTDGRFTVKPI